MIPGRAPGPPVAKGPRATHSIDCGPVAARGNGRAREIPWGEPSHHDPLPPKPPRPAINWENMGSVSHGRRRFLRQGLEKLATPLARLASMAASRPMSYPHGFLSRYSARPCVSRMKTQQLTNRGENRGGRNHEDKTGQGARSTIVINFLFNSRKLCHAGINAKRYLRRVSRAREILGCRVLGNAP